MITVQTPTRIWNAKHWAKLIQNPQRAVWWSTFALSLSLTAVIVIRRLLDCFDQPPSGVQIVLISLVATSLSLVLRNTLRIAGIESLTQNSTALLVGVLTIQVLLLLLSISLPGTHVFALVLGWVLFVGSEASWWTRFWCAPSLLESSLSRDSTTSNTPPPPVFVPSPLDPTISNALDSVECDEPIDEIWPVDVTQQLTRLRTEEGGETIVGGVRVDFAAGERQRVVHLAICPPMDRMPSFQFEQSEGPEVQVEVPQCEPFGIRLEVKLAQTSQQPESVVLQFEIVGQRDHESTKERRFE